MNTMAKLPNEILLEVFGLLQDSPSDIVKVMRTCQKWHRLGATILYRHISLESKLLEDSACALFSRHAGQCRLIQSFSLRISQVHLMGFSIFSADAFDRLTELCDVLASMSSLQTFALSFEEPVGQGFVAPSTAIVSLLQSLPKTVTNLNLDCECLSTPKLGYPHVCHALSALLPRLRSLRLRISHLCSGLLSSISQQATLNPGRHSIPNAASTSNVTSNLEYLFICLVARPEAEHGPHTALCYGDELVQGAILAKTLYDFNKIGAFPHLRQFAIMGRVDAPSSPRNDTWNVFKVRSLTNDSMTTSTFPWCARGGSSSLYMIRDHEGDWFGSFSEICNALEGPLVWTTAGIKAQQDRQAGAESSWKPDHTKLAHRRSVVDKFGVSFRIWKHEDATGIKLLHSRTSVGFDDTAATSQTVPPGWKWVPEGPWNWNIVVA